MGIFSVRVLRIDTKTRYQYGTMSTEGQQAKSKQEFDLDLTLKEAAHINSDSIHILNFATCEGQDHY